MAPLVHVVLVNEGQGPTVDGRVHDPDGGNENEPLVSRGITAHAVGEIDQHGKNQHPAHGNSVEGLGIEVWKRSGVSSECIRSRSDTENDHETRQAEAGDAKLAVNIHSMGADE